MGNQASEVDLSVIAADVAQALGLKKQDYALAEWSCTDNTGYHALHRHGSNLTDPYWRCLFQDWLLQHGWSFQADYEQIDHEAWLCVADVYVHAAGQWAEAPARLVSAVWRKMKEQKC